MGVTVWQHVADRIWNEIYIHKDESCLEVCPMTTSQCIRSFTIVHPYSYSYSLAPPGPPRLTRARSSSVRGLSYTLQQPSPTALAVRQREVRSKIVAGILLNRVYAVGKPVHRRSPCPDQPRPYVPSGLSICIACDAWFSFGIASLLQKQNSLLKAIFYIPHPFLLWTWIFSLSHPMLQLYNQVNHEQDNAISTFYILGYLDYHFF